MRAWLPYVSLVLAVGAAPAGAAGQEAVSLVPANGGWRLQQRLPFDAVFLVAGRTPRGDAAYRVLRLPSGRDAMLDWASPQTPAMIVAWAGADSRLRVRAGSTCDSALALDTGLVREVGQTVASTE